jgi:hypothetical protein
VATVDSYATRRSGLSKPVNASEPVENSASDLVEKLWIQSEGQRARSSRSSCYGTFLNNPNIANTLEKILLSFIDWHTTDLPMYKIWIRAAYRPVLAERKTACPATTRTPWRLEGVIPRRRRGEDIITPWRSYVDDWLGRRLHDRSVTITRVAPCFAISKSDINRATSISRGGCFLARLRSLSHLLRFTLHRFYANRQHESRE